MTWAEKEVPNLELCRRLKELGFPQDGEGWYWRKFDGFKDSKYELVLIEKWEKDKVILAYDIIKAPTCRELNEWLLKAKGSYNIYKWDDYELEYCKDEWQTIQGIGGTFEKLIPSTKQSIEADTLPNTYAKMLIWLVENGYVKFEEVKE